MPRSDDYEPVARVVVVRGDVGNQNVLRMFSAVFMSVRVVVVVVVCFVFRADGLSLRPFFDHSIGGLDLQWGIANGYLVDIHAYAVRTATDIAALPTRMQANQ